MKLISYICAGSLSESDKQIRVVLCTDEYLNFYDQLKPNVRVKVDYGIDIVTTIKLVSSRLVKKITNYELYEMRISVDNEYRIIMCAIDNLNFISASRVILLCGFVKKSTKDYHREFQKALRILNAIEL
jgi:hypothetical protein